MNIGLNLSSGSTSMTDMGGSGALSTVVATAAALDGVLTIRLTAASPQPAGNLALAALNINGRSVLGKVTGAVSPQLAETSSPGRIVGVNTSVSALTEVPEIGARYLLTYEVSASTAGSKLSFDTHSGSPFSSGQKPLPSAPGRYAVLADAQDADTEAVARVTGDITFSAFAVRKAEWRYTLAPEDTGEIFWEVHLGNLRTSGVVQTRHVTTGQVPEITGTAPVLGSPTEGDTLASAVSWGSATAPDGQTLTGASPAKEMSLDGGATWTGYVGTTVLAAGTNVIVRERWETAEGTTRIFTSAVQAVAYLTPVIARQPAPSATCARGAVIDLLAVAGAATPAGAVPSVETFSYLGTDLTGAIAGDGYDTSPLSAYGSDGQFALRVLWTNGDKTALSDTVGFTLVDVPDQMTEPAPSAISDTEIRVEKAADPDDGNAPILGHDLRYRINGGTWIEVQDATFPYTMSGLSQNDDVEVQTRAFNAVGRAAVWSDTASATTSSAIPVVTQQPTPQATQTRGSVIDFRSMMGSATPAGAVPSVETFSYLGTDLTGAIAGDGYDTSPLSAYGSDGQFALRVLWTNGDKTALSDTVGFTLVDVPDQMTEPAPSAISDTEIRVEKAADPDDGNAPILGHDLRYRINGGTWIEVQDATFPYSISGLGDGSVVEVQTRAFNAVGRAALWSDGASATTTSESVVITQQPSMPATLTRGSVIDFASVMGTATPGSAVPSVETFTYQGTNLIPGIVAGRYDTTALSAYGGDGRFALRVLWTSGSETSLSDTVDFTLVDVPAQPASGDWDCTDNGDGTFKLTLNDVVDDGNSELLEYQVSTDNGVTWLSLSGETTTAFIDGDGNALMDEGGAAWLSTNSHSWVGAHTLRTESDGVSPLSGTYDTIVIRAVNAVGAGAASAPKSVNSQSLTGAVDPTASRMTAWWDALGIPDGPVTTLKDRAGPFDLTAVNAPTASGGVIKFDGSDDVLVGSPPASKNRTYALPGITYVREFALPDAQGSHAGKGFSIAGISPAPDGTWWVANGGKAQDGMSQTGDTGGEGDVRKQTIVHLSSDFRTNLGEIDIDALWENHVSPQGVAFDAANNWLWVLDLPGQRIRCVLLDGRLNPAQDVTLSYTPGSVAMTEAGDAIWVLQGPAAPAKIEKIATDGSKSVLSTGTVHIDNRHDHICEYDGILYVSCGTNAAQGYIETIDPIRLVKLGSVSLPYPGSANGLVGIEGIWVGSGGKCYIAHNGYFHYGDPEKPQAPDQYPVSNIVVEYKLPKIASQNFDVFWFGKVNAHTGTDCIFQWGSPSDNPKSTPSLGLWCNSTTIFLRKNAVNGTGGEAASAAATLTSTALNYIEVRGSAVKFYQNSTQIGTGTFSGNGIGGWGPNVNPPEVGGSNTGAQRYSSMDWFSGGVCVGGADRQWIEGMLAHRHGQQALLPSNHPYKITPPVGAR